MYKLEGRGRAGCGFGAKKDEEVVEGSPRSPFHACSRPEAPPSAAQGWLGAEPPRPRHTFVSGHYKMNCFANLLRVTYFMMLIHGTTKNMIIDLHLSVHAGFQRVEKPEESQERMGTWRTNKQRNASGIRSSVEWRRRAANGSYNIQSHSTDDRLTACQ